MSDSGEAVAVMSNGAHVETSIAGNGGYGRIVPIRDAARARELARRRWDKVSAAARAGMAKAGEQIPEVSRRSAPAVVAYLVEQHTLNAADPSARGSAQSFKQVLDLAYPRPERDPAGAATPPAGGATLALSPELARELLAAMRARREGGE